MFLREKVQLLKFGCLSMNRCEPGHKISVKNKLENDTRRQKQRERKKKPVKWSKVVFCFVFFSHGLDCFQNFHDIIMQVKYNLFQFFKNENEVEEQQFLLRTIPVPVFCLCFFSINSED